MADIFTLGLLVKIAFALSVADDLTDVKNKLWETTGEVAGLWLDKLLSRHPAPVRQAMKAAEREIAAHETMRRLDPSRQPVVVKIAGRLLRHHAPRATDIVQAAYDAPTLTAQVLRDGTAILAEIDGMAGENDAVRAVLTILLRHIQSQAGSLQATESLWRKLIQEQQADILSALRALPDDLFLRHLAGLSLLRSNRPQAFRPDLLSASELLTARHTALPLRGRAGEMQELVTWATAPTPLGIRLLTGPGGHGKTRLALELCRHLEQQGWHTGFLLDRLPDLSAFRLADLFDDARPTLITIDYAAGRTEDVRLFADLALDWNPAGRFRLLLVERQAGDWWGNCRTLPDPAGALFRGPACRPDPLALPILPAGIPAAVFADAVAGFAPLLGIAADRVQTPAVWPDDLGLPLFARARALLAVEATRDGTTPPADTPDGILDHLLHRERGIWRRAARLKDADNAGLADMQAAVTLLTLSGTTRPDDAPTLLRRLPRLSRHSGKDLNDLLAALSPLYGDGNLLRGLEPDLLGEHLVWTVVTAPDDPLLTAVTGPDAGDTRPRTALTVLNRLATRKPGTQELLRHILSGDFNRLALPALQVALEQPLPMARLFRDLMEGLTFDTALALADLLPKHTVELREIAVQVETLLASIPLPPDAPPELRSFAALHLNNLSVHLSGLGRREEALAAAEQAENHYRTLADQHPDAFLPDLASALNNLSIHLSDLGRREQALAAAEQAVGHYLTLADQRPDAFLPDLAMALNNLSNRLSNLGRREQALAAAEQAEGHYRTLADQRPDAFLPDLAMALNNLSNRLSDLGRREQALAAAEQAVSIRRTLADQRPDAFLPDLAMALNNLSVHLSGLGRREEALAAAEQAEGHYRTLADQRPDAFLPDLAISISVRRDCLLGLERFEAALDAAREALVLLTPAFLALPAPFGRHMALYYRDYLESAGEAGQEPDPALLAPVLPVLLKHGFIKPPAGPDGAG